MTSRTSNLVAMKWLVVTVLWVVAFAVAWASLVLTNDHFDRISRARQIARYGELPFRDFFDPGYFMTELSSAGLQLLLGDRLLGEILLNTSFIATGAAIVFLLAQRVSRSFVLSLVPAVLTLITLPRLYDFDKVLFYPLGVLLCWRYIERRTAGRLIVLGAGLVAGALFRYDTGVFIGAAAIVALVVVHWAEWATLVRRLGVLTATVACAALPFLLVIQYTAGVLDAADQIVTYARREAARTRISSAPRFAVGKLVGVEWLPSSEVQIRWAAPVTDERRRELTMQYGLRDGRVSGQPENRTWAYRLEDTSRKNIRRLLADWRVEDTHGIDRARGTVASEPLVMWIQKTIPLRILPGSWHGRNASAFLYYLLWTLPAAAGLMLLARRDAGPADARVEVARVLSLIAMCVLLDRFILRDPVGARVGGIAGPVAILAWWMAVRLWRTRLVIGRAAVTIGIALTVWSISAIADWEQRLTNDTLTVRNIRNAMDLMSTSPPTLDVLPNAGIRDLVTYLRQCTGANDRVYASTFVPELYFYAQRGFAGGMVVTFGGHWSEPRYERRILDAFASQPVPIAIIDVQRYAQFREQYAALDQYLQTHYRLAGETDFGSGAPYRVLVRSDRVPTALHPLTSLPCFATLPEAG